MLGIFTDTFKYRDLIISMVQRNIKKKYKRSAIGFIWSFLNPLIMMIIYTVVFTYIFIPGRGENFHIMLLSTLFPWMFFSKAIVGASQSLVNNHMLIHKVYVPKTVFPLTSVLTELMHYIFSLVPMALILLFTYLHSNGEFKLQWSMLYALPLMACVFIFTMGVCLFVSVVSVYLRDLPYLIEVGIPMLFYGSPILWSYKWVADSSGKLSKYVQLNPLYHLFVVFQKSIFFNEAITIHELITIISLSVLTFIFGLLTFALLKRKIPYLL